MNEAPAAAIPPQVWALLIEALKPIITGLGVLAFVVLAVVLILAWRKGKFPSVPSNHQRKSDDALLQIVKENTAAFQAVKSMQEDSRNITVAAVDKLEAIGRVLAGIAQKLEDIHQDLRPQDLGHRRRIAGG